MDIDRQRVAAVQTLEALGYSYRNNEWVSPDTEVAEDQCVRVRLPKAKGHTQLELVTPNATAIRRLRTTSHGRVVHQSECS
jgi:hypothetical protein